MFAGQDPNDEGEANEVLQWSSTHYSRLDVPHQLLLQSFDPQIGDIVMAVLMSADIRDLGVSADPCQLKTR